MWLQFKLWIIKKLVLRRRRQLVKAGAENTQYDLCVGGDATPHFYRWHIFIIEIFGKKIFKVYLHKFVGNDNDPVLHDHRGWNVSWLMINSYIEEQFCHDPKDWMRRYNRLPPTQKIERKQDRLYFRFADTAHRIDLKKNLHGVETQVWSLFISGAEMRNWGFWCPKAWRAWEKYVSGPYGSRGVSVKGGGCGE